MTPSSEATPRPWKKVPRQERFNVTDANGDAVAYGLTKDEADLIVAAVNSYDESRKLLREAANIIDHLAESAGGDDHGDAEEFIKRIAAHLEAGK